MAFSLSISGNIDHDHREQAAAIEAHVAELAREFVTGLRSYLDEVRKPAEVPDDTPDDDRPAPFADELHPAVITGAHIGVVVL